MFENHWGGFLRPFNTLQILVADTALSGIRDLSKIQLCKWEKTPPQRMSKLKRSSND